MKGQSLLAQTKKYVKGECVKTEEGEREAEGDRSLLEAYPLPEGVCSDVRLL